MLNNVDLPQPDGPMIDTNSPGATLNDISSTAITGPSRVTNCLCRPSTRSSASASACEHVARALPSFAIFGSATRSRTGRGDGAHRRRVTGPDDRIDDRDAAARDDANGRGQRGRQVGARSRPVRSLPRPARAPCRRGRRRGPRCAGRSTCSRPAGRASAPCAPGAPRRCRTCGCSRRRRAAERGSGPRSTARSHPSGNRRRRTPRRGAAPMPASASAAPTAMPGPPPMPPPPSDPRKSSGCRNGQQAPFHDSGRCSSDTARSPTAARSATATSSVVIAPSPTGTGTNACGLGTSRRRARAAERVEQRGHRRFGRRGDVHVDGRQALVIHAPAVVQHVIERHVDDLGRGLAAARGLERAREVDPVEAHDDVRRRDDRGGVGRQDHRGRADVQRVIGRKRGADLEVGDQSRSTPIPFRRTARRCSLPCTRTTCHSSTGRWKIRRQWRS